MPLHSEIPAMKHEESGSGDPLILLPGGLTGWISWIPHAEDLSASRRVIRLQLHSVDLGLSGEALPPDYAIAYEIAALARALDDLGIEQADFAGWSYGGATALSYAIHNPQRVKSLTLIEPAAYWVIRSRGDFSDALLAEQEQMQSFATDDVTGEQLISFMRTVGMIPSGVDPHTMPQWESWYEHRQSLRTCDVPFRHDDSIEHVRTFNKPVLLVKGEGSNSILHKIINILAGELPNAQVMTFPGGHAPHILSMQPFMQAFTRFLPG